MTDIAVLGSPSSPGEGTTLARRLYSLLFRWALLFLLIAGTILTLSFARMRAVALEERLVVAQTLARYLDASIADLFHNLRHLASENPLASGGRFETRLRAGRFHWMFRDASYVLDAEGAVVFSDPPSVVPLARDALSERESVTSLVRKAGTAESLVAIQQPFRFRGEHFTLVSEMHLEDSMISVMLRDLPGAQADPSRHGHRRHLFVVDAAGTILAAPDAEQLFRTVPAAGEVRSRILGRQPLQLAESPCWLHDGEDGDYLTVMVPLELAPWGVVLQEPTRLAFFAIYAARYSLFGTLGLLLAIGGLLVAALSRSVIAPIRELSRQAEHLRQGRLGQPIRVAGDGEIRVLAATLDEARRRLGASVEEIRALNSNLEREVAERTDEITRLLEETLRKDAERRALVRRLLAAGEDERKRIARELHDEIAQMVTAVQLCLDGLPGSEQGVLKARNLLRKTQKELHRVIYDLRPSLLDDLGLPAAIQWYAKNYLAPHGCDVRLEVEEELRLPPEIEITLFRIYQEIVTNVLRHAGAERVAVELYSTPETVVLTVEDDGVGFDPDEQARGLGIVGMRERAAIVSGSIAIDSAPGTGTQVIVEFPLEAPASRGKERAA